MKKSTFDKQEIIWNLVNSFLAGALVLLGSFGSGQITLQSIGFAILAAFTVAIIQFKNYWDGEKREFCNKAFNFVNIRV